MVAISESTLMIGTGSEQAVVGIADVSDGGLRPVFTFPKGHGAYAIDFRGRMALAGSRLGRVEFAVNFHEAVHEPSTATVLQESGGEALAVTLTEGGGAVVAGADGLWYWPHPQREPDCCTHMPVNGHSLCSVVEVKGVLYSLSTGGELYSWRLPGLIALKTFSVPLVPNKASLVHMNYWPQYDFLAYPGRNGELVLCALDGDQIVTVPLHDGEFYVVCLDRNELVTIGREDGKIGFTSAPQGQHRVLPGAPGDVVAGSIVPSLDFQILLVSGSGGAGMYGLGDGGLHLEKTLKAEGWRCVVGLSGGEFEAAREQLRKAEVRKIVNELRVKSNQTSDQEREQLHRKLIGLGAEPVSLELKVEAVQAKGADPMARVGELSLRQRQEALLRDESYAVPYLMEYAKLLESLWLLPLALSVYARLRSFSDDQTVVDAMLRVEQLTEAVHSRGAVVELDEGMPIETVLAAAETVGAPVSGQFAFAHQWPFECEASLIDWGIVKSKLEQRCRDEQCDVPSIAIRRNVRWLSHEGEELRSGIHVAKDTVTSGVMLGVAYNLVPSMQTIQPAFTITALPQSTLERSQVCEHNERFKNAVNDALNDGPAGGFWRRIYAVTRDAVWRTTNRFRHDTMQEKVL